MRIPRPLRSPFRTLLVACVAALAPLGCESSDEAASTASADTAAPGDDAVAPGDDAAAPGDDAAAPGDDAVAPGDDAAAPGDDAVAPPAYDPLAQAPDAAGPYKVGHRTTEITYTPESWTEPRTITVHLWYPSDSTDGPATTYLDIFADPEAHDDVPLAIVPWADGYPILVHSHGHQGLAGNSAFLMRRFASHGWLVVAPDHAGNLLTDLDAPHWLPYVRSMDLVASLDALLDDVFGLGVAMDASRIGLSGHSRGVHTGWASLGATFASGPDFDAGPCAECTDAEKAIFAKGLGEARFRWGILMAGSIQRDWYGATGHTSVEVPILSMSGTADPVGADKQFDTTPELDLTWTEVAGACHQTFGFGQCAEDEIPEARGTQVVATWAYAWARDHAFGGDAFAALRGSSDWPEVVVKSHTPPQ